MQMRVILKLISLIFCIVGTIFLNLDRLTWFHDLLSISLCGYVLILIVCVAILLIKKTLDETMDYTFMIIGAVLNFLGGIIAIVYYSDKYKRYHYDISGGNLIAVGIFAIFAAVSMTVDVLKNYYKLF